MVHFGILMMSCKECHCIAIQCVLLLLLVLSSTTSFFAVAQTYHIHPESVCHDSRNDTECLTLSNVTKEKDKYFASNTVLFFHDGEHVLLGGILAVSNISNFNLTGYSGNLSSAVTVVCVDSSLSFSDVYNLEIVSINFNSCNISVTRTTVRFENGEFLNSEAVNGGALAAYISAVHFYGENSFTHNIAERWGGAIYLISSNLTFSGNTTFVSNTAIQGGGIYAEDGNTLTFIGNTRFIGNAANTRGGGVLVETSNNVSFTENCTFKANTAGAAGGAVLADHYNFVSFNGTSSFTDNVAGSQYYYYLVSGGGAVQARYGNFLSFIGDSIFVRNSADVGGALELLGRNNVSFDGNSTFMSNKYGAVVTGSDGTLIINEPFNVLNFTGTCSFESNVGSRGGAVDAFKTSLNFTGIIVFKNNSASSSGGAMKGSTSIFDFTGDIAFVDNTAAEYGGGVSLYSDVTVNFSGKISFVNNTARYNGGGVYVQPGSCIINFAGNTVIEANTAILGLGGGGYIQDSIIYCTGNLLFTGNQAPNAGGLFIKDSSIETQDKVSFTDNIALILDGYGGAIFAFGMIRLRGSFEFYNNTAGFGGGLAFSGINGDFILVRHWIKPSSMSFVENHANRRGGAIYVEDNPFTYCSDNQMTRNLGNRGCFLQVTEYSCPSYANYQDNLSSPITLQFVNNTAVEAGDTVYGGFLDSCIICTKDYPRYYYYYFDLGSDIVKAINKSNVDTLTQVSSDPFKLCLCDDNRNPTCHHLETNVMKYPGEVLTASVVAVGQMNGTVPSLIRAKSENLTNSSDFRVIQPAENNKRCTRIQYPLHSTVSDATLKLYSDEPCSTSGLPLTFTITFLPCPVGFSLSEEGTCICDKRLEQYTQNCSIQTLTFTRRRHSTFWMGAKEFEGLILHPHCPFDYCRDNTTTFTLNSSNLQCQTGRSGILCGACMSGYSLGLGSSQCLPGCNNTLLALVLVFALAGVVLVVFLFLCRLTIADGALGGLIFYANVLAINRNVFFPSGDQNFLTVFIAWLNLDLGITTCFFESLDAYYKTWLQFVFPIYIWLIVGAIIFLANRSTLFAGLIGSTNPVAILATLFLLSYTKLLRAIMAAFSFATLDYPNGKMKYVWLYDGNLDYLDANDPRHVSLFLFSLLFLALVFLPYTLLLLCGQWIQTKLWWLSATKQLYVKSFLDAYYAPYKHAHRYWVGLLLLLRFLMLFVTTVINISNPQDPFSNLLVVLIVALIVSCWITSGIFKKRYLDLLEVSFSFNLVVMVGVTYQVRLSGGDQAAVVYTSTAIAFVIFLGIVLCAIGGRVKEKFPENYRWVTYSFSRKKENQDDIGDSLQIVAAASNVGYSSLVIANPQETAGQLELRPGNRRGDENN